MFVSPPVVAICTALPVAALVISNSFTALVVVCKRINSLPLASAIKPPSTNLGAVSVLFDNVSVPVVETNVASDTAVLNSAKVPVKVPSDKSKVIVLFALSIVLLDNVSVLLANIYDCKSEILDSVIVIVF